MVNTTDLRYLGRFQCFLREKKMLYFSCVPFDQSKSGFCDPKFDFPFHY